MNRSGADMGDMDREPTIDPQEADDLLAGRPSPVRDRFGYVSDVLERARAALNEPPSGEVEERHLMAMAETFAELGPGPLIASGRRTWIGRRMLQTQAGRAAALALAGLVVTGSALAATGNLPEPVQDAVADAVHGLVDLPGGSDDLDRQIVDGPDAPGADENGPATVDDRSGPEDEVTDGSNSGPGSVSSGPGGGSSIDEDDSDNSGPGGSSSGSGSTGGDSSGSGSGDTSGSSSGSSGSGSSGSSSSGSGGGDSSGSGSGDDSSGSDSSGSSSGSGSGGSGGGGADGSGSGPG